MTALLIDDPVQALEAVRGLSEPIALDTEFHAEHRYHPRLMVLQLRGAGGPVHLLDGRALDMAPLAEALSGKALIAHAPTQDLAILRRHGLSPGAVTDTQILAGFRGLGYPRSLSDLLREVLGHPTGPTPTLSNWSRRPLDAAQLAYAAADVAHLHELADALDPGGLAAAAEACTEEVLAPPDPARAWERLRAAAVLAPSDRRTLQRLAAWRQTMAEALDQPLFQVASDASLIDLARRRPTSVEAMKENRRFPKRLAKAHGEALLPLLDAPPDGPWDYRAQARTNAAALALQAFAARFEVERGVAARLTLPEAAIPGVLASIRAGSPPTISLSTWRRDLLETEMSRFVTDSKLLDLLDS